MITNISPIIPQHNGQAIAQDNQEANLQQNFNKIRNPILKDIANNLGNNELRQGYLSDLSNPDTEFKSFFKFYFRDKGRRK
ncbi:MAG: hypothetical protein ACO201_01665 [Rickettsiales bacterium]